MSKERSILEEVKRLVFGEEAPKVENTAEVTEEQNFEAVTLSDGTMLQIEPSIEVGASVLIEDAELGMVPVPDGSYELEDGRIISVAGGLIEAIEEMAEAEQVEEEMETETTTAPTMTEKEVRKIIESVETHFKSEIETLRNELANAKEEAKEINGKFISALEQMANEPTEKPKKETKNGFNFRKKDENKLNALINYKKK